MTQSICCNCFRERTESSGPCSHCGYDPAADQGKYPFALPHGSILAGQFITGRILGQGGFGITYLARDNKLDTKVAIKEFLPDSMAVRATGDHQVTVYTGQRQENFRYGMDRFLDEARVLAKFQGNPSIVGVRSYFEENGTAYFVMDYIQGDSFKSYIQKHGGKVAWQDAVRILTPVMDALGAVHKEGIIHRDVTPDNIILTPDGGVKLLDFGSARYSLGDKSKSLDVVLKAGYAPKEQYIRRGKQGPYTDIYSLAACFYAAITGYLPPEALERMDEDELVPPSTRGIKLPAGFEDVILKGLEVQPGDRYQSMEEFRAALDSALREEEPAGPIPGPAPGPSAASGTASEPAAETASVASAGPIPEPVPADSGAEKTSLMQRITALPKAVKGGVAAAACLVIVIGALAGSGVLSGGKPSPIDSGSGAAQDGGTLPRTAHEVDVDQLESPEADKPENTMDPADPAENPDEAAPPEESGPEAEPSPEVIPTASIGAEKTTEEKVVADKKPTESKKSVETQKPAEAKESSQKQESPKSGQSNTVTNQVYTLSSGSSGTYTGPWENGKPNGKGTFVFDDGKITYTGNFISGIRSGYGEQVYSYGASYKGNWKDDKFSGSGTYVYMDGDSYEGNWSNGHKNGSGVYRFSNSYSEENLRGGRIEGTWEKGSIKSGKIFYVNGDTYNGAIILISMKSGYGTYTWADGRRYEGNWKYNDMEGEGTLYKADGTIDQAGTWKANKLVKSSVPAAPSASTAPAEPEASSITKVTNEPYTMVTSKFSVAGTYTGQWKDGKPNGEGTMTMTQSDERWDKGDTLYSAKWVNGLIEGYGQWRSAVDGAYDGNFSKGLKSGKGKMWFSDGTVYDGQWSGGDFVG